MPENRERRQSVANACYVKNADTVNEDWLD
jgi:hypothetical protein